MQGETESDVAVGVVLDGSRLQLILGDEILGDWDQGEIGINALHDGFLVRAEGEVFVLKTDDDAGLAEGLGMTATTLRLARKVAASHPPAERPPIPEPEPDKSLLGPVAYALAGALVLAGGSVLRITRGIDSTLSLEGRQFWVWYLVGGALMVAVAYALAIGVGWARLLAVATVIGLVVLFVITARGIRIDSRQFLAYGFIAGGLVLGAAIAFSGRVTN